MAKKAAKKASTKKPSVAQLKNREMIKKISERAKKIYLGKEKEKYSNAVKRAAAELKKRGENLRG